VKPAPAAEPDSTLAASTPAPPSLSRFHVASLTFLRARQLHDGARPRVEVGSHKVLHVALLEVLAGAVSWELTDAVAAKVAP
jgi:DNA-directed RNA polymerase subunit K/omega